MSSSELDAARVAELVKSQAPVQTVANWLMALWDGADTTDATLNDYYEEQEKATRLLTWTLEQVYGEFLSEELLPQVRSDRVVELLTRPRHALILMDSLSLREACLLRNRLPGYGYQVTAFDHAFSELPSTTEAFCARHWGATAPSAVNTPNFVYVRADAPPMDDLRREQLTVWGTYPDWFWRHAHSGKTEHITPAEIYGKTEAMLLGILKHIKGHDEIVISSDHGYLMLKAGMAWHTPQPFQDCLKNVLGGRSALVSDSQEARALLDQGMIQAHGDYFLIRGRYTADFGIYQHGGLSLMECLTPWLVIRPR